MKMKWRCPNVAIRCYTDEDVHAELAPRLRSFGWDAQSYLEHDTKGWDDARQLDQAVATRRAIVTSNRKDFRLLHRG
jgi:hypothetical protein